MSADWLSTFGNDSSIRSIQKIKSKLHLQTVRQKEKVAEKIREVFTEVVMRKKERRRKVKTQKENSVSILKIQIVECRKCF